MLDNVIPVCYNKDTKREENLSKRKERKTMNPTYTLNVYVRSINSPKPNRVEKVCFYSLFAAAHTAEKYIKCVDVCKVEIIDNETGEVMFIEDDCGDFYSVI